MAAVSASQAEVDLCESPVPASMFSPEPDADDSDCSFDGEPLRNGEAEIDLTSKVSEGACVLTAGPPRLSEGLSGRVT